MSQSTAFTIAQFAILFGSIVLHEVSHGWSALALGDDTAKRAGRLSLNPLVHVDPLGTVILPAILLLTHSNFLYGWAKPVPVSVNQLRSPRNDAVVTSLAGPAMNVVLVTFAWAVLRVFHPVTFWPLNTIFYLGLINLWLAMFNMLPIPPLDGSSIVERFLPTKWWGPYLSVRPYTLLVVMGFVIIGAQLGVQSAAFIHIYNWWLTVTGYR